MDVDSGAGKGSGKRKRALSIFVALSGYLLLIALDAYQSFHHVRYDG